MTQALVAVVLFMAAMAALPWLVRRYQQRQGGALPGQGLPASRVVSAVSVGPQQRVVTVEVGPPQARMHLVLGVTAQQISCLHVCAAPQEPAGANPATHPFAQALRQEGRAQAGPAAPKEVHHGP